MVAVANFIPEYTYLARFVGYSDKGKRVYNDGDTATFVIFLPLNIRHEIILRFARIDAPEMDGPDKLAASAAAEKVRDLLMGRLLVIKTLKDKKEGRGRYLGEIYFDQDGQTICLNDYLVENGFAVYKQY